MAQNLVNDLVKKGEETVQQGKVVNTELKHNVSEKLRTAADNLDHIGQKEEAASEAEAQDPVVVEMVEVDGKLVDKLGTKDDEQHASEKKDEA
jgi:polyhydroxyalkanoate synthesis regulator phasin